MIKRIKKITIGFVFGKDEKKVKESKKTLIGILLYIILIFGAATFELFREAQEEAQTSKRMIWDPETNRGGPSRDYDQLLPWWEKRGDRVRHFREQGRPKGALSPREDYPTIVKAVGKKKRLTLFCDLQQGIRKVGGGGAISPGSKTQPQTMKNRIENQLLKILYFYTDCFQF